MKTEKIIVLSNQLHQCMTFNVFALNRIFNTKKEYLE